MPALYRLLQESADASKTVIKCGSLPQSLLFFKTGSTGWDSLISALDRLQPMFYDCSMSGGSLFSLRFAIVFSVHDMTYITLVINNNSNHSFYLFV